MRVFSDAHVSGVVAGSGSLKGMLVPPVWQGDGNLKVGPYAETVLILGLYKVYIALISNLTYLTGNVYESTEFTEKRDEETRSKMSTTRSLTKLSNSSTTADQL